MIIRPVEPKDYAYIAPLWNAVYENDNYTPEEFAYLDSVYEPPCKFARFVAELDGEIIGACNYAQHAGMYHPQKFLTNIFVYPDKRSQGVGTQLYDFLAAQLDAFNPLSLSAQVREDDAVALAFAAKRGFEETKRDWEAVIDPAEFDAAPYAGLEPKFAAEGITLTSFADWGVTPERENMFFDFFARARLDVPSSEPRTPYTFELFRKTFLDAPDFFSEGVFFALDGGDITGMTMLWRSESTSDLYTGLTAVDRNYRGRGLATALKVRALKFAAERGCRKVLTDNDTTNVEMIAVNDKLGFKRLPAWLSVRKTYG